MLIEYTIEIPCDPKRRFTREGLFDRLRVLAGALGMPYSATGERAAAREVEYELRPLAFHCARCPASYNSRAYGCFGMVQGPLSSEGEEWLLGLLPESLQPRKKGAEPDPRAVYTRQLIARLAELGATGKLVDERYRPGLLERRRPAQRRYGSMFRPVSVTSSQLLQVLLFSGVVAPLDAELAMRALGVWEDGERGEDGVPEVIFTQPADDEDDPTVADLKQFFMGLMVACSLNVAVRTRVAEAGAADPRGPGKQAPANA